jgi:hypothetical protein
MFMLLGHYKLPILGLLDATNATPRSILVRKVL